MKPTTRLSLAALAAFTIAGPASAATVLLTDNFNTSSRNGATFNDNTALTADQSGSLATLPYTLGGSAYSDGASMTLNMQGNGWGGEVGFAKSQLCHRCEQREQTLGNSVRYVV